MKSWLANVTLAVLPSSAGTATGADCPAALDFHKYLLDREGRVVASFRSQVDPQDPRLIEAIEALL